MPNNETLLKKERNLSRFLMAKKLFNNESSFKFSWKTRLKTICEKTLQQHYFKSCATKTDLQDPEVIQ